MTVKAIKHMLDRSVVKIHEEKYIETLLKVDRVW